MVTRKPLPPGSAVPHSPASPSTPKASLPSTGTSGYVPTPKISPPAEAEHDSDNEWDQSDPDWDDDGEDTHMKPQEQTDLPVPLRAGKSQPSSSQGGSTTELPSALKAGPPEGSMARESLENMSGASAPPSQSVNSLVSGVSRLSTSSQEQPKMQSYNPFLRPQRTGDQIFGSENSSQVWANEPSNYIRPANHFAPVELPAEQTPIHERPSNSFSAQNHEQDPLSPNSRQPPLIPVESEFEPTHPQRQDSHASSAWDPDMDISHLDAASRDHGMPADTQQPANQTWQEQQTRQQRERLRRQQEAFDAAQRAQLAERERKAEDEWYHGEAAHQAAEQQPPLPPRHSQDEVRARPPQPRIDTSATAAEVSRPAVDSPNTVRQKQRSEHYQIKQIRWHDAYSKELRTSPILIQNANGPCPLLALVNTLVLSTPMGEETALVETLRTREQVSLGLLLDAVFDELMSGRRGSTTADLPDVSELYAFLLTLHTGMNVNPRFVFASKRSSAEFHPALRDYSQPGSFEETKEMRLYSTFNVPLMHGWLPERDSPAYAAFERSAKTYEDAQNIQFHEEELEQKLDTTGLTPEEQHLFQDLHTIKEFLSAWPTQLTVHGLNVLSEHLSPGRFAILFRNDHFSTMYKEPLSQQLLTLVTDAGYSTHDEIVWESLVDVNGADTEHFSGDFRPVSHHTAPSEPGPAGPRNSSLHHQNVQSMLDVDQGWTTVQNKRNRNRQHDVSGGQEFGVMGTSSYTTAQEPSEDNPPALPARTGMSRAEQEDADLALALQLQEEEEERERREQLQRRREEELSHQYIEQDARSPRPVNRNRNSTPNMRSTNANIRPLIPPRRNNQGQVSAIAAGVNRPAAADSDEPPPPSYEQAAKGRPFHPPNDHPASPLAPINPALEGSSTGHRRQQSAYMSNSAGYMGMGENGLPINSRRDRRSSRPGVLIDQIPANNAGMRRRSTLGSPVVGSADERGDKCVIM